MVVVDFHGVVEIAADRFGGLEQRVEVDSRIEALQPLARRNHPKLDRSSGLQLAFGFRRRDPFLDQRFAQPLPIDPRQCEQRDGDTGDGAAADQQRPGRIEQQGCI